jgi:hypothetical protein
MQHVSPPVIRSRIMHSIIPLFPQACRHGACHPGSTEPPPIGVVAAEAGGLGVAPGVRQPAVGYQVPTPCVGALGCHEEGVSQVLICGPCTGGALSVGQKPLAWTKAGGNSAIRTQYRQTNVEDSVESGGEHAREWVIDALLLPSGRMQPLSPTTARGEVQVHHAPLVRGKRPALVRAAQSRRVSTRTGICRLVLC